MATAKKSTASPAPKPKPSPPTHVEVVAPGRGVERAYAAGRWWDLTVIPLRVPAAVADELIGKGRAKKA